MRGLKIRGHHLLCLQGFRGLGYNEEFVEQMKKIVNKLSLEPGQVLEVVKGPDNICGACPHHRDGCRKDNLDREAGVKEMDQRALARLGLAEGERLPYSRILSLIREKIRPEDLSGLCGDCPWLSLGYCQEGIALLGKSWSY